MSGHVYKRCGCPVQRDAAGKKVNCPKTHGSWYFVANLPAEGPTRRRQHAKPHASAPREGWLIEVGDARGAAVQCHLPELEEDGRGRCLDLRAEHRQADQRPPRVRRCLQNGFDVQVR